MNIFKELILSIYSYKSYGEFLKNKKSKVFLFAIVLMFFYFLFYMPVPFAFNMITAGTFAEQIEDALPEFELKDGYLWMEEPYEYDDGREYICIDTDPEYVFYNADEIGEYLYGYTRAILMDSEKMILKSNGVIRELYFTDLELELNKQSLINLAPFIYLIVGITMVLSYLWMTALFFFGVLFVALIGMIVASCMNYQLTFGQSYLLGIYARTLPLIIKSVVNLLPFGIPFFFVINFGISVLIIGCAIRRMKESMLRKPLEFNTPDNNDWGNGYY